MSIYYSKLEDTFYLYDINAYKLLEFGVDLNLELYRNDYLAYTVRRGECDLNMWTRRPRDSIKISKRNILEYISEIPEEILSILYQDGILDKNQYIKLSLAKELIK